jgi:cytochrome c5
VDALLLAASRVALPPPVDPSVALPEPESAGARLVARHCAACHAVPTPQIHSAADWPLVARRMWLRIDGLSDEFGIPRPTGAERTVILRYLSLHALQTSGAALPEGSGRNTYVEICGRCHELPDVHSHAAGDWGTVVDRMQGRMESMLGTTMEAEERAAILGYLARATRQPAQ